MRIVISSVLVALLLMPFESKAQLVAAVAAGITGKELIAQADKLVQDAISSSGSVGNALINKGATEASLLARSIEIGMANQLDKSVRDIQDKVVREPLLRLAELADQVGSGERRFYRMRDASVIDLQELASSTIFADSSVFLQRIDGIAYLQQSGDFKLGVTALGLRPTAGRTAVVRLLMDGKAVVPLRVDTGAADLQNPGGTHTRSLVFSADLFANRFKSPTQVSMVPAVIEVTVTTKRTILRDRVESVKVPIYISLIPRQIGDLTVRTRSITYGWVRQPAEKATDPTPSRDCGEGKCRYTFNLEIGVQTGESAAPIVGHQRIVDTRWTCEPLWGPTSCRNPGGWINVVPSISPDKSKATLAIEHWAEKNRYQFFAAYDQYVETGIRVEEQRVPVAIGEQFSFVLPPHTTSYQVIGRLINNFEIDFTRGQANEVLIRAVESDEPLGAKRVSFQVSRDSIGL